MLLRPSVSRLESLSLPLLLLLAYLLQGAKTPLLFTIWAVATCFFVFIAVVSQKKLPHIREFRAEGVLLALLISAQLCSREPMNGLLTFGQLLIFLLFWTALKTRPSLACYSQPLHLALAGMASYSGLVTIYQYFNGHGYQSYGNFPVNPIANMVWLAAFSAWFLGRSFVQWMNRSSRHDAVGWLDVPAFNMAVGLLCSLSVFIVPVRSAQIAFGLGLLYVVYPFITFRRSLYVLGTAAVILLALPNHYVERRVRLGEGNYRYAIWKAACNAAREKPLTGYGPGNFEFAYLKFPFPVFEDPVRFGRTTIFAHSEYFQVLAELGFPAFLILVLITALTLRRLYGLAPFERAAGGALIVMVTAALTNIIWHYPILVAMTLLWASLIGRKTTSNGKHFKSVSGSIRVLFALLLLSTMVVVGVEALRFILESRGDWESYVRWIPADSKGWRQWGLNASSAQAALPRLSKAVALAPKDPYNHEAYGRALEASGDPSLRSAARSEYLTALQLAPGRSVNQLGVGRTYFLDGDMENAQQWIRSARQLEPNYFEADLWLARIAYRSGRTAAAEWILRNLEARHKRFMSWHASSIQEYAASYGLSAYEKQILAYDPEIVRNMLADLKSSALDIKRFKKR